MSTSNGTVKSIARLHGYWIHRNFLSRTQRLPVERCKDYIVRHLRDTLVSAAEGTAHYRRTFGDAGFDPRRDFKSLEDLARVPVLTKDEVRANFRLMVDRRFLRLSFDSHTSGTTGQPMQMRLNEHGYAFYYACKLRQWSWAGYRLRDPVVALRSYVPRNEGQPLWRYSRSENTMYFSAYHLTPRNCEEYMDAILRFKPQFLRGYPSSVVVLAEYAYPVREKFANLKGIFTASETLLPTERETIERTFGSKLFDWYGMTEPVPVITECEAHEGMHINWESGYGEFLTSEDLGPNEYRLVATGFHNPVMPFIRYETGDVVRLYDSPRTCACGRTMPLVESISGRKDDCIITPDGRRLPSLNFYTVFRKYAEVLKFQIVQYGRSEVTAKIGFRPEASGRESLVRGIKNELRARLGPEIALEVEVTDRFLTNADGKTSPILHRPGARSVEEMDAYVSSAQVAWTLDRQGELVFKFDQNEADQPPSPAVVEVLRSMIENPHSICWYPEPASEELLDTIGTYAGVTAREVLLTHGSDFALEMIATTLIRNGDKALLIWPTYDNLRAVVEHHGGQAVCFDFLGGEPFPLRRFEEAVCEHAPRLVYLANPNMPLGYALDRETILRVLECCARFSAILLVDEAYYEFCGVSVADMVRRSSDLLVTRTFSKAFGLAGLRLGYILAGDDLGRILKRVQNPRSVTTFAKIAVSAAFTQLDRVEAYVEAVRQGRENIYSFFDERGIPYRRSHGNFILFEHTRPKELAQHLAGRNILVRDCSRFFGGRGHVRVSVAGLEGTKAFLAAMGEYFSAERARPQEMV